MIFSEQKVGTKPQLTKAQPNKKRQYDHMSQFPASSLKREKLRIIDNGCQSMSKQPYYEFKILLVGDPAVGKTSLIAKFVEDQFDREYKASTGVDFAYKTIDIEEKVARLILWDIASQKRFAPYRTSFYQQTNGALIVFDLTRHETLESIESWMREVQQNIGDVEVVLIGNKSDLAKRRKIQQSDVQPWIDRYGCSYIETSAKTGEGVEEAFRTITLAIISKLE